LPEVVEDGLLGEISGYVTGPSGAPIAEALVVASGPQGMIADTSFYAYTGADGHYRLTLEDGSYYVRFSAPGYAPVYSNGARTWVQAQSVMPSASNLNVQLDEIVPASDGAVFFGQARTIEGKPIAGALVLAEDENGAPLGYAYTDTGGSYRIEQVRPGRVKLRTDRVRALESTAERVVASGDLALADFTVALELGVATEPEGELPETIVLDEAYPNPFNPSTTINFTLSQSGPVTLEVYDVLGRRVVTLLDEVRSSGPHTVRFEASGLPSGIYVYRLKALGQARSQTMMLMK
jgi:hypothetical protein